MFSVIMTVGRNKYWKEPGIPCGQMVILISRLLAVCLKQAPDALLEFL